MKTFMLHCSAPGCETTFPFRHPSVTSLERLMAVTLECPKCGTDLHVDEDAAITVPMIPMKRWMTRSLQKQGIEVDEDKIGFIDLGPRS